jgi:hypothetical protein
LHGEGADLLPRSQDLRSAGPDPYDDTPESNAAVQLVFDVVLDVLSQLDRERVFGSGPERARIVIGVWMGDQSDEQRIEFARRLNPPATVQRFAEEMEAGYAAFQELARHRRNDG